MPKYLFNPHPFYFYLFFIYVCTPLRKPSRTPNPKFTYTSCKCRSIYLCTALYLIMRTHSIENTFYLFVYSSIPHHAHVCTYTHLWTPMCMYVCVCIHTSGHLCVCMCVYVYTPLDTYVYVCVCMYTHYRTPMCMYARAHTHNTRTWMNLPSSVGGFRVYSLEFRV
jgi:hypothetical protein